MKHNKIPRDRERIHIKLTVGGVELQGVYELPVAPEPKRVILPILQKLTDGIVQIAEAELRASGQSISCRKGCDACCRQMVPVSPTEARGLAEAQERLAPDARQRVLARFERAMEALEEKGVLDRLRRRKALKKVQLDQLDRDYFDAQVACPFLELHACMIHATRPLACREFVVSSDPRHCAAPGEGNVTRLDLPAKPSVALCDSDGEGWLPLILAREFTAQKKERPLRAATALQDVLGRL